MICCICYGSDGYREAAQLNVWSAIHKGKADKAIAYAPEDIPNDFREKYHDILSNKRGGGYWLWKPFVVIQTFDKIKIGDYLCYCDARMVYLKPIKILIAIMEKYNQNIMCFANTGKEAHYSKRDAFLLLDCDNEDIISSNQIMSGFFIIKKNQYTREVLSEWFDACADRRINTDDNNVLGQPNYEGFVENRHDQTAWSLITKKHHYLPFRDPTRRRGIKSYGTEVNLRSIYPMMLYNYHEKLVDYTWNNARRSYYRKLMKHLIKRFLNILKKIY